MYKYFVSYSHSEGNIFGFGCTVLEANKKISDFDNIDDCNNLIRDMKKWIENNSNVENVVILNFTLL